jgi:cation diffusion facilitator CzcD-associated flavoprotein CzcO
MADHCIVGAGPAGLAATRAFLAQGLEVDVFERHDDVGGIWDQDNPGSPMYDSAHFISSRTMSGFHGYPMPDGLPDYPSHREVLAYVRDFAAAYDLYRVIELGTSVERAELQDGGWTVTLSSGETRRYRTLVCANGTTWTPNRPELPGESGFSGEVIHSHDYRSRASFAGRRVLVVGAGNSGVDIACDAAQSASSAAISVRRGYHIVPKYLFGTPADVFADSGPHLPMPIAQRLLTWVLRLQVGDPTKHGWPKPDHRLFETHPILNDQVLHHLRHGDLKVRPDISGFDGDDVLFRDGSREPFDLVVLATGYRWPVPYVDPALLRWRAERPDLYLHLFSREHDGLSAIGFTEGDGGAYGLFDEMADLIARATKLAQTDAVAHARLRRVIEHEHPDLSGGVRHVATDRMANYLNMVTYRKVMAKLRAQFGWPEVGPASFEGVRPRAGVRSPAGA